MPRTNQTLLKRETSNVLFVSRQSVVLAHELLVRLHKLRVNRDTRHRTKSHTLGLVKVTYALRAFMWVYFVDRLAHIDGLVGAFGFAHIAIDAFIGNK
jgi:hypothetical protein